MKLMMKAVMEVPWRMICLTHAKARSREGEARRNNSIDFFAFFAASRAKMRLMMKWRRAGANRRFDCV
jgi:hypothetical protein